MKVSYISRRLRNMDVLMFSSALLLLTMGTIMIFSSSSLFAAEKYGSSTYFLFKHAIWFIISLICASAAFFMQIRWLEKGALFLLGVSFLLLLLTLFSPLGVTMNHARRWLDLGFMKMQASEFVKPAMLIYLASYFSRKEKKIHSFKEGVLPALLTVGIFVLFILKQPDFGSAFVLASCAGIMMYAAGVRLGHLFLLGIGFLVSSIALIQAADYRRARLMTFLDPWGDPSGSGFQILQSMVAFERGGVYGRGLGDGVQKLLYLPEAHTDFIFSVIAEEFGLFGTSLVILLFGCLVVQGIRLAGKLKDSFASLLAVGLVSLLGIQAFFNMAVVTAMVPTKGLTLPFISYGGSSLLSSMICLALLLSLSASVEMSGKRKRGLG